MVEINVEMKRRQRFVFCRYLLFDEQGNQPVTSNVR